MMKLYIHIDWHTAQSSFFIPARIPKIPHKTTCKQTTWSILLRKITLNIILLLYLILKSQLNCSYLQTINKFCYEKRHINLLLLTSIIVGENIVLNLCGKSSSKWMNLKIYSWCHNFASNQCDCLIPKGSLALITLPRQVLFLESARHEQIFKIKSLFKKQTVICPGSVHLLCNGISG